MCGGGGWDPGEATDDTQMAVLVAESLLERGGPDLPDIFARFQRWAASGPKDVGLQTEDVLTNGMPWDKAAAVHFQVNRRAAGNGSLMRATTSAVHFAPAGQQATMNAARRIAALTHGDRAAWEGTAVFHELIRVTLEGADPLAALPDIVRLIDPAQRPRYATVLAPDWHPDQATEFNGAVWPCLGSAVWALRTTATYEDAIRAAIDLGGDTDTVAAVTGGLAGACYGLDAIPTRWTAPCMFRCRASVDGSSDCRTFWTSHTASRHEPLLASAHVRSARDPARSVPSVFTVLPHPRPTSRTINWYRGYHFIRVQRCDSPRALTSPCGSPCASRSSAPRTMRPPPARWRAPSKCRTPTRPKS